MKKNRNLILFIGVLEFICLGLMYSWSKFSLAIRTDLTLNQAEATAAYSICMGAFTGGILLDGIIGRKFNSNKIAFVGTLITTIGYLLTTFLTINTRYLIYVTYGLAVGFGIGLVYNEWLNNVVQHFPDKTGFGIGTLLLGMGISGITTTPLMATLATNLGWRISFRTVAVVMLVFGIGSNFFIEKVDVTKKTVVSKGRDYTPKQMMLTSIFWLFAVWKLIMIGSGQSYSGQVSNFVYDLGCSDNIQLLAVSLFVLCNGCSRLLWGFMLDHISNKKLMYFTTIMMCVSISILRFGIVKANVVVCIIALALIGLAYGGTSVMGTNFVSSMFGNLNYRTNNGISAFSCLPGSVGITYVTGFIRERFGEFLPFINYDIPVVAISFILLIIMNRAIKKEEERYGS